MVKVFDWILVVSLVGGVVNLFIANSLAMGLLTGIVLLLGLEILNTLWKQEQT